MSATTTHDGHKNAVAPPTATLVWIDSREAYVARWRSGRGVVQRLESDVPVHRRSTGHVRHDAGHGRTGSSAPQPPVEGRRLEHLERFIDRVADSLPEGDLIVIGPGTVREHLVNCLEQMDAHSHRPRHIDCSAARPMTEPQLLARLRAEIGAASPRKPTTRRRRVVHQPSRLTDESRALADEIE